MSSYNPDGEAQIGLVLLSGDLKEEYISFQAWEKREGGIALTLQAIDGGTYDVLIRRMNDPRKIKQIRRTKTEGRGERPCP